MRAIQYQVLVAIDPVHSWSNRIINEIYVPELQMGLNEESVFLIDEYKFKLRISTVDKHIQKEIEIEDSVAEELWKFCLEQKRKKGLIKRVFDKIEKI